MMVVTAGEFRILVQLLLQHGTGFFRHFRHLGRSLLSSLFNIVRYFVPLFARPDAIFFRPASMQFFA